MASLENRSISNLIEIMADERWKRLAEQQGVAYAKTVAEAMGLKIDADNPADREKLRRAIFGLVAGESRSKNGIVEILSFSFLASTQELCPGKAETGAIVKERAAHSSKQTPIALLPKWACSPMRALNS